MQKNGTTGTASLPDGVAEISVNQATTRMWGLRESLEAYCRVPGVRGVGLWPEPVARVGGPAAARRMLDDAGLAASSLACVAGFPGAMLRGVDAARRALDDAVTLGAPVVLLVAGPRPPGGNLGAAASEAAAHTREGLQELVAFAREAKVRLSLEPLHPVDVARHSTVVTLQGALHVIAGLPDDAVGLTFDTWNLWWDRALPDLLPEAKGRIALVQVADWGEPSGRRDNRVAPGAGVLPMAALLAGVRGTAGYAGPWYEIEVANPEFGPEDYPRLLADAVAATRRLLDETAPGAAPGAAPDEEGAS